MHLHASVGSLCVRACREARNQRHPCDPTTERDNWRSAVSPACWIIPLAIDPRRRPVQNQWKARHCSAAEHPPQRAAHCVQIYAPQHRVSGATQGTVLSRGYWLRSTIRPAVDDADWPPWIITLGHIALVQEYLARRGLSAGVTCFLAFVWNDSWWRSLLQLVFVVITYGKVSLWAVFSLLTCGHTDSEEIM